MATKLVFIIQAFNKEYPDGTIGDVTTVELIDTSCDSAIERAKGLITKKEYRVSSIIERDKNVTS